MTNCSEPKVPLPERAGNVKLQETTRCSRALEASGNAAFDGAHRLMLFIGAPGVRPTSTNKTVMRSRPADKCPLCPGAGQPLYEGMPDRFFGAGGQWRLVKCQNPNCGLVWMNPMPVAGDLHLAYEQYFTHSEAQPGLSRRLALAAYDLLCALPDYWTSLRKAKRSMAFMFLENRPPGSLLDVGCGDGRWLHFMRQNGWQVTGLEVDPQAVEQARKQYGLEVFCGELGAANLPLASFDAITLRHVIEHVPQPIDLLAQCKKLIKPGGLLVVVTPNTDSLGHQQFGRHWMGLDVPRHLHLFNRQSLSHCAKAAGCRVLSTTTSAANAATFYSVSLSLTMRQQHTMNQNAGVEPLRVLRAFVAQYRQAIALQRQPDCGEELVLLATP